MTLNKWIATSLVCLSFFSLFGCGHHHSQNVILSEKKEAASEKKDWPETSKRLVVTSMASVYMMEALKLDLVGVPNSDVDSLPHYYLDATKVGSAMTPDMELIRSLNPDYVFSPISLVGDLKPKYDQINLNYGFFNLSNVDGMYQTIEDLGKLLNRQTEAKVLVRDYEEFMAKYRAGHKDKPKKKVLILMGLPGSYVVATEDSYVGSLVKMAGGENVYPRGDSPFLNVNIEDMLKKEPDLILRTAHALPKDVMAMFDKEFKENNNWKHFKAVKKGEVYDLDHKKFGMSAKLNYKEALKDLEVLLYGE